MQDLTDRGLVMRDEKRADLIAQSVMVGDYLAADIELGIFGNAPPISVGVQPRDFRFLEAAG